MSEKRINVPFVLLIGTATCVLIILAMALALDRSCQRYNDSHQASGTVAQAMEARAVLLADSSAQHLWTLPIKGEQSLVVLRVIDGDSCEVAFLTGPVHVRISGIDAPEMSTPEGKRAKAALEHLLPLGVAQTWRLDGKEKFGRTLADVQITQKQETGWLSWWMLNSGTGVKPYDGGKR